MTESDKKYADVLFAQGPMGLLHSGWTVERLKGFQQQKEVQEYLRLLALDFTEREQTEARAKHWARRRVTSMLPKALDILDRSLDDVPEHAELAKIIEAGDPMPPQAPSAMQLRTAENVIEQIGIDTKQAEVAGVRELNLKILVGGRETTLEFDYDEDDAHTYETKAISRERTRTAIEKVHGDVVALVDAQKKKVKASAEKNAKRKKVQSSKVAKKVASKVRTRIGRTAGTKKQTKKGRK